MKTGVCDCSLKELLMMGIMVPEKCWAASVRLSYKFYDWFLHLVGCFIWLLIDCICHMFQKPGTHNCKIQPSDFHSMK
jgi:hypothetical protein